MEKKILVALNGSLLDGWSCDYLCANLFTGQDDIIFHLLTIIPFHKASPSMALLGDLNAVAKNDKAAVQQQVKAQRHLESLARRFVQAGFRQEQIQLECKFGFGSTAATLLQLGQKGLYDALLLSKRDIPALLKFATGSISAEIMARNHSLPLWVVNGNPAGNNFLVPVDCTKYSLDAVDHLGFMLQNNPNAQVTLFHSGAVLAAEHFSPEEEFYDKWGKDWCAKHLHGSEDGRYYFQASEQVLMEAGIAPERIHRLENKKGVEPGQTITNLAEQQAFSTIVMGRRPDKKKGLFKGVSDRVLANVTDVAVWLVG